MLLRSRSVILRQRTRPTARLKSPCGFDKDSDVDGHDLAILAGEFGKTDCP